MNLARIHHLYRVTGPFASIAIDVARAGPHARHGLEKLWENARSDLAAAGAQEPTLDALGERVLTPTDLGGSVWRTVVATGETVVFDDLRTGEPPRGGTLAFGPLPDLSGWLQQVESEVPLIAVVADRSGADVSSYGAISQSASEHQEVTGETLHITKVPQGDWAQKQFQRRSENVWRSNAQQISEVVRDRAEQHQARIIVLVGDVRARTEIRRDLEQYPVPEIVDVTASGRAVGSSTEAMWQAIERTVAAIEQSDTAELTELLNERSGQDRFVARGLRNVLDALVQGKVERLFADLGVLAAETVAPTDYPGIPLPEQAANHRRLPADQVIVAAAAMTDASFTALPADVVGSDGIAATLRWDD